MKAIFVKDLYDKPDLCEDVPVFVLSTDGTYHEIEFYRDMNMGNGYQLIKPGHTFFQCVDGHECELKEFDQLWINE